MKLRITSSYIAATVCLLLGLVGCGGGSGTIALGPTSGGSFSGTTITINPTLQFGSGGTVTYTNNEPSSDFPAAPSGVVGSYVYTPSSDYASGTLRIDLPAPIGTITFSLRNFQNQGGSVTSFDVVYGGRAFTSTVTSGTLPAKNAPSSNGSGSPLGPNEKLAPATPAAMQGSYDLYFSESTDGSPFEHKTKVAFVIGASTLQIGAPVNKTLTNPIFRNNNPYEWIFKDGSLEYAASIGGDDTLNEINLAGPGGFTPFYGQFPNRKE